MRSKESTICGGDEMDIQRYGRSVALGALAFASVASHAQTGNPGSPDSENGPEMAQSAQDAATSYGEPTLEGQSPTEVPIRSEEHTSELQSLMRISYAVFCLKKKKKYTATRSTDA